MQENSAASPLGFINQQMIGGDEMLRAVIENIASSIMTATIVKVVKSDESGIQPVGTVAISPLVDFISGDGSIVKQGTIFNAPYFRLQGGSNAVVIDPAVGDIGIALFCHSDISGVKKKKDSAPPATFRHHSMSDAIYIGGILNGTPEQFLFINNDGVSVRAKKFKVEADEVEITSSGSFSVRSRESKITSPTTVIASATEIAGTLSQTGGGDSSFSGNMRGSGSIDITGEIRSQADIRSGADVYASNGKRLSAAKME